jgi:hypothetical protein
MRNRTGRPVQHTKGESVMQLNNDSRPSVSDLIAYIVLIFAIGLAISIALGGAVLLLAGQPV